MVISKEFKQVSIIFLGVGIYALTVYQLTGGSACPIYHVVGIPCPGCGMGRSAYHLITGNLEEAIRFHPLVFSLPIIFYVLVKREKNQKILLALIAIFLVVWVARMVLFFPGDPPMDFNEGALLQKGISFLK